MNNIAPDLTSGTTHEVTNQPPPLEDWNLFTSDTALREAVTREGGDWGTERLTTYGALCGGELQESGFLANENKPVLKTHDRYGHRIDRVDFHPAYHRLMQAAIEHEIPSLPWKQPGPGAHVVRSALSYMHSQIEAGTGCPLTMTFAVVPALRHQPDVWAQWETLILSNEYDPAFKPHEQKAGLTLGMGMTEKQGGSDVRANTTRAVAVSEGGPGGAYAITGHKWFFSAPMCDAFLVLAQAPKGISCFLMPRWRPDGSLNAIHIQRLKDKLGNWSNASSEVEFHDAHALLIGEEGRGVPVIIDMVMHTRLDCITGSAALMRQAVAQAAHHCAHREAFGKTLIDQPLMQNVLADIAMESEAAMLMSLRVSRALDEAADNPQAAALARIGTAVGKYWVCKRTPMLVNEAQECMGGAGYVEESILPRLYREAPLNSIWEGSGNVQCLDVLRALAREPATVEAMFAEFESARGQHALLDKAIDELKAELADHSDMEVRARRLVEQMAVTWQSVLMQRSDDANRFEAFCTSRLGEGRGRVFGTIPAGPDLHTIARRAQPVT